MVREPSSEKCCLSIDHKKDGSEQAEPGWKCFSDTGKRGWGGWLSGNESDQHPRRLGFGPWPHSVGYGSGVAMSCGVGRRHGSDPALLWLWWRPAAAAPIRPLAWEPPYAAGVALKR